MASRQLLRGALYPRGQRAVVVNRPVCNFATGIGGQFNAGFTHRRNQRIFQHSGTGVEFGDRQVVGGGIDQRKRACAAAKPQLFRSLIRRQRQLCRAVLELDAADDRQL